MFVDLVGSTALSARLDPEDMRDVIRAYQNAVAGEIARFEGHVAKFMGDGVLGYFGWPRAHEDEPERAVRAGLATLGAIARLSTPGGPLQARIGVATGLVVVGDLVGEGAAQEQAVVGDTPNLAARLQAAAEPGMLVIGAATRRLVGDLFLLRDLGAQSLKGIAAPAAAFAVLGERALESRFAAQRPGALAPIVGRDQELALLLERWRQAGAGEGQVVLLSGEAGIGKSRIVEAVVEAAKDGPHYVLRYQCSPYHAEAALYPVVQQLAHAAGFAEEDDPDRRLDRLEALLAQATDDVAEAVRLIAPLLDLDATPRHGALALTPQQRRSRTLAVLIEQLAGLARRRPVLWVIEDAHWIDPTTLELVELALDRVQGARVLLLITARPVFVASFASHPVVTRLTLNRLARAATQAIVARLTGGRRLPEALLDEIAARTDGVPLFVEEMTKAVLESGALRETADAYHLSAPLSTLAIPTTLHDSLMARLDRLHPVKEVAQTAAVIGRDFDHGTIAALAGLPEGELAEAMARLVEAELVFRRGTPPDAHYLFKHALVRDAAYQSLLKTRRTELHGRLIAVLEARGDAPPGVKAQHAEAAGLAERALGYWEEAGAQALARPAYREAIASLDNAIRLCRAVAAGEGGRRREQALQLQRGQALIANQGYQAVATLQAFEQAQLLAEAIGDPLLQLPALYGQWASFYILGGSMGDLATRYAAIAEAGGDAGVRLIGHRMLGLERFHEGRFRESLDLVERSLALYDPAVHRDLGHRFGHDPRTAAANYRVWNLWHLGFPDQAAMASEENLAWTRAINHANTTGIALCYGVTTPNIWLRRPERVESGAREAIGLAEEMSLPLWHAWGLIHLGWALSQRGTAPGLEEIEAGLEEARRIGAGRMRAFHHGLAAEAYATAGRHREARRHIDAAFAALEQGGDRAFAAELHRLRAGIGVHGGEAGERDLRRALEIATEQEAPSLQLRAARDLARLLDERREGAAAAALLAPILDGFTEGLDTPDLRESATAGRAARLRRHLAAAGQGIRCGSPRRIRRRSICTSSAFAPARSGVSSPSLKLTSTGRSRSAPPRTRRARSGGG
ncbi:MAG: AAA family ATPase [Dongiaceae bacterium]